MASNSRHLSDNSATEAQNSIGLMPQQVYKRASQEQAEDCKTHKKRCGELASDAPTSSSETQCSAEIQCDCESSSMSLSTLLSNEPGLLSGVLAHVPSSEPSAISMDWNRRNEEINKIALVSREFWRTVAPQEVPPAILQRRVTIPDHPDDEFSPMNRLQIDEWLATNRRPWWVVFTGMHWLNDRVLMQVASQCPTLNTYHPKCFTRITSRGLVHMVKHCPSLTSIVVGGDVEETSIRDEDILFIARQCPRLTVFDIDSISNTTLGLHISR